MPSQTHHWLGRVNFCKKPSKQSAGKTWFQQYFRQGRHRSTPRIGSVASRAAWAWTATAPKDSKRIANNRRVSAKFDITARSRQPRAHKKITTAIRSSTEKNTGVLDYNQNDNSFQEEIHQKGQEIDNLQRLLAENQCQLEVQKKQSQVADVAVVPTICR